MRANAAAHGRAAPARVVTLLLAALALLLGGIAAAASQTPAPGPGQGRGGGVRPPDSAAAIPAQRDSRIVGSPLCRSEQHTAQHTPGAKACPVPFAQLPAPRALRLPAGTARAAAPARHPGIGCGRSPPHPQAPNAVSANPAAA